LPDIESWSHKDQLAKEREALGFYLSDHPLRKFEAEYNSFSTIKLGDPDTFDKVELVRACGVITAVRTRIDKSGRNMAFFRLDDFTGSCECIMFNKVYSEYGELIKPESTIMVFGKLESSGDAVKLHVDEVVDLAKAAAKLTKSIGILIDIEKHDQKIISEIKTIFESNDGNIPIIIYVKTNGRSKRFLIDNKVSLSDQFKNDIQNLLGEDTIAYQSL
jgi:DNA polymerase-3 subunit alpha